MLSELEARFGASDQDRERWLSERRSGVTATELRDLMLGHISRAELIALKLGRKRDSFGGNAYTAWGTAREAVIAAVIDERYAIAPESRLLHAEDNSRFLASPDGVGVDFAGDLLVDEIKTAGVPIPIGSLAFDKKGYRYQMTWVMRVSGARRCLYAWEERIPDGEGGFLPGELHFEWLDYDEDLAARMEDEAVAFLDQLDAVALEPFVTPDVDEDVDTHAVNYLRFIAEESSAAEAKKKEYNAILAEVGERESFQQEGATARVTLTPMKVGTRVERDTEAARAARPDLWEAAQVATEEWERHARQFEREVPTETKPRLTITPIKQKETK